jgi:hypothetical protein
MNGTTYDERTPRAVIDVLERARAEHLRVRIHYGDQGSGQDWGDVYDVAGYIGRSTGPVKIPLLIANSRSTGGGAILDHCIVRIRFANRKDGGDLYRHISYTRPLHRDYAPKDWSRNFQ